MAQIYENYWSITNAFTDYNGSGFINTLKTIIEFIDREGKDALSKYDDLQDEVQKVIGINLISVRKAINQMVKLGFIEPELKGYLTDSKLYINAKTNRKRQTLLSKIVYSNAKLNSSVTDVDNTRAIQFLINTLEEVGKLSIDNIKGLMTTDISHCTKEYLTSEELFNQTEYAERIQFDKRKYNQIGYLINLLKKLDDIVFVNDKLYFKDDAKQIFGEELQQTLIKVRNPYLHRIYKIQLKEESEAKVGGTRCMLEKLDYPVLIASHIKPFINCDDEEAYDPENGLLLSRTIDSMFDLGYISFDNDGSILFSQDLSSEIESFWKKYIIDTVFLTDKRLEYLEYHRTNVFKK